MMDMSLKADTAYTR